MSGPTTTKVELLSDGNVGEGGMHGQQVIERTFRCMLPAAVGIMVLANTCGWR